jgi:hypothetical protein
MWVNASTVDGTNNHIFNKSESGEGYELYILGSDNKFTFESGNGGWLDNVSSNDVVVAGQWYHVAITYDGATYKMYIDGVLQSDTTSSSTYPAFNAS